MKKFEETIKKIGVLDAKAMERAKAYQNTLTKPQGSLGVLEDISVQLAGITGEVKPKINKKTVIVMAGDHGVADEGVSAFPKEVTPQMVYNFLAGGAGINVLARHVGAEVVVVDIGVAADLEIKGAIDKKIKYGTDNMAEGPAMSREEAIAAIESGIEVAENEIKKGADILATGDMGIANTTPSSAILAVLTDISLEDAVGRGTGIDDEKLENKKRVIKKAFQVNNPDKDDPLDVLSKVGGLEIAGLAGVILAAAANSAPVIIDGFISGAAALIASRIAPKSVNFMIASHVSVEPGHKKILSEIGLSPMLHLNMRLGEGTGAALAMNIMEAACKVINEMATFEAAGVSEKSVELRIEN
jgi:nicotinate-nucleotide--dimethylbenzimidazole phosphoribosyltransferase